MGSLHFTHEEIPGKGELEPLIFEALPETYPTP